MSNAEASKLDNDTTGTFFNDQVNSSWGWFMVLWLIEITKWLEVQYHGIWSGTGCILYEIIISGTEIQCLGKTSTCHSKVLSFWSILKENLGWTWAWCHYPDRLINYQNTSFRCRTSDSINCIDAVTLNDWTKEGVFVSMRMEHSCWKLYPWLKRINIVSNECEHLYLWEPWLPILDRAGLSSFPSKQADYRSYSELELDRNPLSYEWSTVVIRNLLRIVTIKI